MSISCPHCGAVASYGQELGHKSDCPALSGPPRIKTLRFSNDWLRKKIANDPNVEVEAGIGHPEAPGRGLKCPGVGRDKDCVSALQFYFSRKVTDDEMRFLHEVMQRAVASIPSARQ